MNTDVGTVVLLLLLVAAVPTGKYTFILRLSYDLWEWLLVGVVNIVCKNGRMATDLRVDIHEYLVCL